MHKILFKWNTAYVKIDKMKKNIEKVSLLNSKNFTNKGIEEIAEILNHFVTLIVEDISGFSDDYFCLAMLAYKMHLWDLQLWQ